MPAQFVPMTRHDFATAIAGFDWRQPKSEVHVHHTWRPNHAQYRGEQSIIGMWRFHTEERGWSDIAQHVSIAPDGTIWSGRNWNASPVSAVGHNHRGVFMFETIGDFDDGKDPLHGEQLESVLFVTASLQIYFNMPLWFSVRFHNQMSSKTCPGSSVDRANFIRMVSTKRAELEGGLFELVESTRTSAGAPQAAPSLFEQAPLEAEGAPADEELEHDNKLEEFMETFHAGIGAEAASIQADPALASLDVVNEVNALCGDVGAGGETTLDDLYLELGRRVQAIGGDPGLAGRWPAGPLASPEAFGDHLARLGQRIFDRVHRQLHDLMCGTGDEDAGEREKLKAAFGLGSDAVVAALVGAMTTGLGIAPAIATVVAAIIVRRLLLPAYAVTCEYWAEQLSAS